MKMFFLVLLGVLGLVSLLIWFAVGGTKTVLHGNYGPFTIGQNKALAAETLQELQVWPPLPIPSHQTLLESPSLEALNEVFGNDEGLNVWFGLPAGAPMTLEFQGDMLSAMWPRFEPKSWSNQNPGYDEIDDAMLYFQDSVFIGMSRKEVFLKIANNETGMSVHVTSDVAGWLEFEHLPYDDLQTDPAYSDHVLSKNAWTFVGLHDTVWYSFVKRPHYSQVRLYFEDDLLTRIEHQHGPAEMP